MSDVIKLLPDSVANQIAAGEVIQRPASVVKELMENAIDAHATSIQVILKDAGRTLIQIIDNGVGMTDTDARLAFERHSTSKIRKADDLFTLHTMGFRGEALASIAAISQVELRTRQAESQLGTKLIINASTCESQEPIACPPGSNFMIKNLFFNVPARRKFLKSNQVEMSNILKEFEKIAMINHNVEFTLTHNGTVIFKLNPNTMLKRIGALMGHNLDEQLMPLNIDTTLVRITGFIGKPAHARKRGAMQFLFANDRYMRHPYFHKAIMACYEQLIPAGEQPNYFLSFHVDPETIDVNIHPTKTEIKFENEKPIWQILAAGVRETLGRFNEVPSIDFDMADAPVIPAYAPGEMPAEPSDGADHSYNPFKQGGNSGHSHVDTNWEELYANFEKKKNLSMQPSPASDAAADADFLTPHPAEETTIEAETPTESLSLVDTPQQGPLYLQMKGRYILSPIKSGLMIIDQHRAHERILFERYMSQLTDRSVASQTLLFPEVITLEHSQSQLLVGLLDDLEQMGFTLSQLSGDDWAVNSVPTGVEIGQVKETIMQIIDSVEHGGDTLKRQLLQRIALTVAKTAAIPYGRSLTQEEMDVLVSELLRLTDPNYTPEGKLIISTITMDQMSKMFS